MIPSTKQFCQQICPFLYVFPKNKSANQVEYLYQLSMNINEDQDLSSGSEIDDSLSSGSSSESEEEESSRENTFDTLGKQLERIDNWFFEIYDKDFQKRILKWRKLKFKVNNFPQYLNMILRPNKLSQLKGLIALKYVADYFEEIDIDVRPHFQLLQKGLDKLLANLKKKKAFQLVKESLCIIFNLANSYSKPILSKISVYKVFSALLTRAYRQQHHQQNTYAICKMLIDIGKKLKKNRDQEYKRKIPLLLIKVLKAIQVHAFRNNRRENLWLFVEIACHLLTVLTQCPKEAYAQLSPRKLRAIYEFLTRLIKFAGLSYNIYQMSSFIKLFFEYCKQRFHYYTEILTNENIKAILYSISPEKELFYQQLLSVLKFEGWEIDFDKEFESIIAEDLQNQCQEHIESIVDCLYIWVKKGKEETALQLAKNTIILQRLITLEKKIEFAQTKASLIYIVYVMINLGLTQNPPLPDLISCLSEFNIGNIIFNYFQYDIALVKQVSALAILSILGIERVPSQFEPFMSFNDFIVKQLQANQNLRALQRSCRTFLSNEQINEKTLIPDLIDKAIAQFQQRISDQINNESEVLDNQSEQQELE